MCVVDEKLHGWCGCSVVSIKWLLFWCEKFSASLSWDSIQSLIQCIHETNLNNDPWAHLPQPNPVPRFTVSRNFDLGYPLSASSSRYDFQVRGKRETDNRCPTYTPIYQQYPRLPWSCRDEFLFTIGWIMTSWFFKYLYLEACVVAIGEFCFTGWLPGLAHHRMYQRIEDFRVQCCVRIFL